MEKKHLTNKQELEMWSRILHQLQTIPENFRSRNHTEYVSEVEFKLNCCYDIEEEVKIEEKP